MHKHIKLFPCPYSNRWNEHYYIVHSDNDYLDFALLPYSGNEELQPGDNLGTCKNCCHNIIERQQQLQGTEFDNLRIKFTHIF